MLPLILSMIWLAMPPPFFNLQGSPSQVSSPTFSGDVPTCTRTAPSFPGHCAACTVTATTSTTGAHLFYTNDGSMPTHVGDTPTGVTKRVGSNSGTVYTNTLNVCGSYDVQIVVIGYLSGQTDSVAASQEAIGNCLHSSCP